MRTAVLTISTSVARRQAEDASGPLLAHLAEESGCDVESMEVIPDDFPLIEDRLHHYVDDEFTFVFTTGGTGLTPGRRHPRGDEGRHRARRARDRRGDARDESARDPHGDALARRCPASRTAR